MHLIEFKPENINFLDSQVIRDRFDNYLEDDFFFLVNSWVKSRDQNPNLMKQTYFGLHKIEKIIEKQKNSRNNKLEFLLLISNFEEDYAIETDNFEEKINAFVKSAKHDKDLYLLISKDDETQTENYLRDSIDKYKSAIFFTDNMLSYIKNFKQRDLNKEKKLENKIINIRPFIAELNLNLYEINGNVAHLSYAQREINKIDVYFDKNPEKIESNIIIYSKARLYSYDYEIKKDPIIKELALRYTRELNNRLKIGKNNGNWINEKFCFILDTLEKLEKRENYQTIITDETGDLKFI